MLKSYPMFHRVKADRNKFQTGDFASHLVLVGLEGAVRPSAAPAEADSERSPSHRVGSQPCQEAFTVVKQYLLEIQTACEISKITRLLETKSIQNNSVS